MRTLFLHVGPAKTGTSAVQHVLSNHAGDVVCYPKVGLWADGSHHNLVLNFLGQYSRPEVVREDGADLFVRIGQEANKSDRDIVISSEILAGTKRLNEFAEALVRHIDGKCRVELVMCVREHFERGASLYNQRVKDRVTLEQRDPDEFLADKAESLCYIGMVRRLRRTGYELTVLNYHPAESCVARTLGHLGFLPLQIPVLPARNVSLSTKALIAMLAANRVARSPDEREQIVGALSGISGRFAPSQFIFDLKQTAEAGRIIAEDRKFLFRRFRIVLPAPDPQPSRFKLLDEEFEEIASATRGLGTTGTALRDALSTYRQGAPALPA